MKKQKLELTWIGKDERPKLEPRILIEDADKSYHAKSKRGEDDIFDNRLIFGDNLLALKALEQEFAGKVKCIYIDPPFNTGGAFQHYDDNVEHSLWLNLMSQRFSVLYRLLSEDGAIVVNLDDTEVAYCKVVMDGIFGRSNYITTIVVEGATPSSFKTTNIGPTQTAQYLLFFCKDKAKFKYNQQYIPIYDIDLQHFSRFIENFEAPAHEWRFQSINDFILGEMGFDGDTTHAKWAAAKRKLGDEAAVEVRTRAVSFAIENGHRVFETKTLQKPSKWLHEHIELSRQEETVIELKRDGMDSIYLYKGRQLYFLGKGIRELDGEKVVTQPVSNIWLDIPTNNLKGEGGVDFPSGKKPEALLRRVIQMISDRKGDLVLDSFAGSGTTGAVAHKMGRRWIMVELGEHCHTHIIPRLQRVIDGEDSGGITEAVNWQGGGGFRYYRLAPSLLEQDSWGNWVISKDYNSAMLAEAVCKLNGFTYAPSDTYFWQHGYSTERDFIYVTTQTLTREQLAKISEEVGDSRSLLVCCGAFRVKPDMFPNLTLRKIPKAVLSRCEWGKDDYSLKVNELPVEEPKAPAASLETKVEKPKLEKQGRTKEERRAATVSNQSQMGLFEKLTR